MKKQYLTVMGIAAVLGPVCVYAADAPAPPTEVKTAAPTNTTTAATAAAAATPATTATPATEAKAATTATEGTVAEGAKPAKPVYCPTSGKIRVRADSKNGCSSAQKPYRSYSKEQIDETGRIDVAEALETIDPIFHPN